MSDLFPGEPGQDDAALAPELARLDELLLAEGRRWRRNEPPTAGLERYARELARPGASSPHYEEYMRTERNHTLDTPPFQPNPQRATPRWGGPLAAVATVLLVAMAASVFTFLSGRHTGVASDIKKIPTPGVTRVVAIQPKDTYLPAPTNAYLSDLSFSSAHDGWAVGGIVNSSLLNQAGAPVVAAQGVLVHYHDGVWTAASDTFPGINLESVSMVSADDGWAVGFSASNAATDSSSAAVLLHYTGGHWVMVKTPALVNAYPRTIRMLSQDFGYITGQMTFANLNKSTAPFVAIYQNGEWKAIRVPFPYAPVAAWTTQTVMVSASEGWASALTITHGIQQATIYHYLNGAWTQSLTFPGYVTSLSAASPADVWALADQCANCAEPTPRIEHYNGAIWERVNPPSESDFAKIPGFGANRLISQSIFDWAASGVWTSYTVYDTMEPSGRSTAMWEYANGGWQLMSQPITIRGGEVVALAADGNGGLWAIAQTYNPFATTILYSQGKDWKVYGRSR